MEAGYYAVDIYLWRYVDDRSFQRDCLAELSTQERQRAQELYAPGARSTFVQRRAYLGWLLRENFGATSGPTKSGLNHTHPTSDCGISVSSSGTHAIYAVGSGIKRIGIDVEIADEKENIFAVADALFTDAETTALKQADPRTAADLFYRIWRLKEAALKFRGSGLAKGLNGTCFVPNSEGLITVYQKARRGLYGSTAPAFFEGRFNNLDLALALPAMPGDEGLWQVAKATQRVQSQKLKTKTSQIRFGT